MLASTGLTLYFAGNVLNNAVDNSIVGINSQNFLAIHDNILNNPLLNTTRIQVVIIDATNSLQFTKNQYTHTLPDNAKRLIELETAKNVVVDDNNHCSLEFALPKNTATFPIPVVQDMNVQVGSSVVTFNSDKFDAVKDGSFIVAYGGKGGKVDTSFDRTKVTFTFNGGETHASFYYVVKLVTGGINTALCHLSLV